VSAEVSRNPIAVLEVESLKGWLPVDAVVANKRPGLCWMDMRGVKLSEPFFQQTVERLRAELPTRPQIFTEFDALVQLEKISDSLRPSGFIFHSSRCGSTLVANACRALSNSIVISEAYAIDKLVGRFSTDGADGGIKELLYSIFVRGAVNALGQRTTGNERHFFIKFSSCSVAQLGRIRRIWPDVPWLFLYRDPTETIVSNLRSIPEWLEPENEARVLADIIGSSEAEVHSMGREELCARAIARFYSNAYQFANGNSMLLNYNQLSLPVLLGVIRSFKVAPSTGEIDAVTRASQVYSKDTRSERAFIADSDTKQLMASALVREMAERWAAGPYQLLEQKRTEIASTHNDEVC
jgi:hypothetical protein